MFPLGGLYEGHYAEQAIRRYWDLWMPLLFQHQRTREPAAAALLVPPLDVQWAWFVHRLNPNKYLEDCRARFGQELHPAGPQQALGFSGCSSWTCAAGGGGCSKGQHCAGVGGSRGAAAGANARQLSESEEYTRRAWAAAYPSGPGLPLEHQHWPPAPAWLAEALAKAARRHLHPHPQGQGGEQQRGPQPLEEGAQEVGQGQAGAAPPPPPAGSTASVRSYVIEAMPRQGRFLHQVLRAPYFSHAWLAAGVVRYLRFLAMARSRAPSEPLLVPMYDIDLVWHSHMALSGAYATDCRALLPTSGGGRGVGGGGVGGGGKVLGHDDGLAGTALADPFAFTRRKYESEVGLMYNVAPTRRIPTSLAHPLVAAVWPLAAVLADPRPPAPPPPPPRAVAAQLASQAREPQRLLACTVVAADGAVSWGPGGARTPAAVAAAMAAGGGGKGKASAPGAGPGTGVEAEAEAGLDSGSSKGVVPSFATANGEWAQCMLGSPDHLKRSGAVGLYALWRLAEALRQLAGPGAGGCGKGCSGQCSEDQRCDGDGPGGSKGSSSSSSRRKASSGGAGARMLHVFGCLRGGGAGGDDAARLDEAMSRMTHDLLRLADPASPHSPVSHSDHPFWRALLPLPAELRLPRSTSSPPSAQPTPQSPSQPPSPPPSQTAPGPAVHGDAGKATPASGVSTAGVHINVMATACCGDADAAPPTTSTTTSQAAPVPPAHAPLLPPLPALPPPAPPPRPSRFPAPPPALDLPVGFAPASARDVDCVWLAPHHFVLPAPVFYTHADLCTLGRGSWCLPPRLATPEASGGSADPRHLLPLQQLPAHDYGGANASGGTSAGSRDCQGPGQQQWLHDFAGAAEDFDFELEDYWAVAAGGGRGRGLGGRGGSSINALGAVVHSPAWHKRLLRSYSRVYKELMRQRKAQQPDRATVMEWGLEA